jgi:GntR family transcriptional regulator
MTASGGMPRRVRVSAILRMSQLLGSAESGKASWLAGALAGADRQCPSFTSADRAFAGKHATTANLRANDRCGQHLARKPADSRTLPAVTTGSGPTDARPLQVRIADDLRLTIESGTLAPGAVLPTVADLMARYRCSTSVARTAVQLLREQGLVVSIRGKGSFVRQRPTVRRHGISRYARSAWSQGKPVLIAEAERQGHDAGQILRELAEVPAPPVVAERLKIDVGKTVWVRRRTTTVDGRPNQMADSYYPLDVVAPGRPAAAIREENTGPGGGFARLEESGYRLSEIVEDISVRMPVGPESVALALPPGTPVVDLIRTTYTDEGLPVEVMVAVIAGDQAAFSYRFPIPD